MRRGWINPPLLLIKRKKNKKYNKNKNFNIFLTKIIYILLKNMKINAGKKVPKIANFGTKWDFFAFFDTPNITLSPS